MENILAFVISGSNYNLLFFCYFSILYLVDFYLFVVFPMPKLFKNNKSTIMCPSKYIKLNNFKEKSMNSTALTDLLLIIGFLGFLIVSLATGILTFIDKNTD